MKYHLHIRTGKGFECRPWQYDHWDEARAAANKVRAAGAAARIFASPDIPGHIQQWQQVQEESSNGRDSYCQAC